MVMRLSFRRLGEFQPNAFEMIKERKKWIKENGFLEEF